MLTRSLLLHLADRPSIQKFMLQSRAVRALARRRAGLWPEKRSRTRCMLPG